MYVIFLLCFVFFAIPFQIQAKNVTSSVPSVITNEIYFQVYKGPTNKDYVRIKYADGLTFPQYAWFKENSTSVFHLHGWGEDPQIADSVAGLASAFLKLGTVNFIAIDYSHFVRNDPIVLYIQAAENATFLGRALGEYFKQYIDVIQPGPLIHLTSHSLGSQIFSRSARVYAPKKYAWATGLDPAGPIFKLPGVEHLSKIDADFVDVIHTDGYLFGDQRNVGHADFFPNRGHAIQPPCRNHPQVGCSHGTSWEYYADSVNNIDSYPAVKCIRTVFCDINLYDCICDRNYGLVLMGYGVNKTARGSFFLETKATPPYGMGVDGTYF